MWSRSSDLECRPPIRAIPKSRGIGRRTFRRGKMWRFSSSTFRPLVHIPSFWGPSGRLARSNLAISRLPMAHISRRVQSLLCTRVIPRRSCSRNFDAGRSQSVATGRALCGTGSRVCDDLPRTIDHLLTLRLSFSSPFKTTREYIEQLLTLCVYS